MSADLLLHAVASCMKTDTAPPQGGRRGPAHNYMFPRNIAENIMPVKLIVPSSLPGGHGGLRCGGGSLNHPRRRRHFLEQRRVLLPEPQHGLCVPAPGQPRMAGNLLLEVRLVVCATQRFLAPV